MELTQETRGMLDGGGSSKDAAEEGQNDRVLVT